MRTILVLTFIAFLSIPSFSQSDKTIGTLNEISGEYQVDDNGNVTYVKIIEVPETTKEVLYTRAVDYFTYRYNDGESVIQVKDKESGHIVAKGLYQKVFSYKGYVGYDIDTWHILTVDVKEGKARAILSLTEYRVATKFADGDRWNSTELVSENYPINPKGLKKNVFGGGFAASHEKAIETFALLEKTLKEGTTYKGADKKDW